MRQLIGARGIEEERASRHRNELGRCIRIAAGEQGDFVALRYQLFSQIRDDFPLALESNGGNALIKVARPELLHGETLRPAIRMRATALPKKVVRSLRRLVQLP